MGCDLLQERSGVIVMVNCLVLIDLIALRTLYIQVYITGVEETNVY